MSFKNKLILLLVFVLLLACLTYFSKPNNNIEKFNSKKFSNNKKYLLFSSIGTRQTKKQAIDYWTKDANNRNFDIVLYYYDQQPPENCFDYCLYKKGTKYPNFYHFATNNDISNYEAIWIVDDDIKIETKDINKMFFIFNKYNLDIAQPSYTKNSHISHKESIVDLNCKLRFSNFVENGAAIYSKKAIKKCMNVFKYSVSGWGTDFTVCKIMNNRKNIAFIDETPCLHEFTKSSLDNVLTRNKHQKDGEELYKKFNIKFTPGKNPYNIEIYKKVLKPQ